MHERTTTIEVNGASDLAAHTTHLLAGDYRLALIAAHHDTATHPGGHAIRVVYLFTAGPPDRRVELHLRTDLTEPHIPSLAALSFPASRFEREMRDLFGIEPDNHPMPRPLIHHPHWPAGWHPMRHDAPTRPPLTGAEPFPFLTVEGDGVYEIPVGPVHAGLIEPGHFRFSVVGETILKMKARLWYVHKGIEKLFEGRPVEGGVGLAERVSGDTAVGHALAYSLAVEDALRLRVPTSAQRVRAVLLELERLHNHIADIGALCNDVAYGIAHAHTQRIRECLLRLNAHTTGHRLLRGGVYPGGARLQSVPDPAHIKAIAADVAEIIDIALGHAVVRERFTGTAVLTRQQATDIGTLGYVARASGLTLDARTAHPFCDLGTALTVPVQYGGDVLARFRQRAQEIEISTAILTDLLPSMSPGTYSVPITPGPGGHRSGTGIVEGWRGAITHRVETGPNGRITRAKIVDPSFFNWPALPVALADTIVPDFPLTNKSFNLSCAGNDL
ncbi:NADH-quinone oxidoreductase subunit C [Catellatospora chokoriensis]|uniref:Formate hydrogenase HycE n=1 Tax=Catellatospora chokoriensis TaxID=310353 RepID=A0A8J3K7D6_9ACTN|nr:NADH-quinone oxidoreductase subunit C [Catellatospora chokoriensis]GIF94516.1 formate hydrogenase HycE [Catellatospora chokoriensis]